MDQNTLRATPRVRDAKGSNRRLRNEGRIPAVIYGGTTDPRTVSVDHHELELILRGASRSTALFNLEAGDETEQTILREVQRHPVSNRVIHLDFQRINLEEELQVEVSLHVAGQTPVGVRNGGILEHVVRTITIACRPTDIPHHIDADLTNLEMNHSFHVSDLVLPAGVRVIDSPETALFVIAPPKSDDATAPGDVAEPEVIGAKKKEDEK